MCFTETSSGQYRLRPLYYVSDADKAWYKEKYGVRYSDAYEVYGLTRTGCCGCPISYKAVADLEKIKPYEPNVVKAAWPSGGFPQGVRPVEAPENLAVPSFGRKQQCGGVQEKNTAPDRSRGRGLLICSNLQSRAAENISGY